MKTIKYLGFYAENNLLGKRVLTPSVTNKMDYIISALKQVGVASWVISPVNVVSKKFKFDRGFTNELDSQCKITYFNGIYGDNVLYRFLGKVFIITQLVFFLLKNLKKGETILVYHHPFFFLPVFLCKKLKKIKIVLEVEEIYQNIWPLSLIERISENLLLKVSSEYIVVSENIALKYPEKSKIIIHGSYNQNVFAEKQTKAQNSINIVYGGSIDKQRNAAFYAAECAELLPDNYIMNICGYGNDSDVHDILDLVNAINQKAGVEKCIFHGLLLGDDYQSLLQKCDIAINIQNNYDGIKYSLPSKILTYLSANLKVITTRLDALENSPFSSLVQYIDGYSPEEIATVIKNVDLCEKSNASELMKEIHLDVCEKLSLMFS